MKRHFLPNISMTFYNFIILVRTRGRQKLHDDALILYVGNYYAKLKCVLPAHVVVDLGHLGVNVQRRGRGGRRPHHQSRNSAGWHTVALNEHSGIQMIQGAAF